MITNSFNADSGEDKVRNCDANQPLVSVRMPVYNQELYISYAVESVLGQTFTDFELIIVDDGSTDRTVEIVKRFDDPCIRVGVTGIRTVSMRKAKTHLSRCSSPLQIAASDLSPNVGTLTLEPCEK